mmetsp:Transcript_64096/g.188093  ORF Transcript_64096/g.188093 Transcript_64096/m.188093 type:complete len:223 (+) Transcript_64096:570-1238(+)
MQCRWRARSLPHMPWPVRQSRCFWSYFPFSAVWFEVGHFHAGSALLCRRPPFAASSSTLPSSLWRHLRASCIVGTRTGHHGGGSKEELSFGRRGSSTGSSLPEFRQPAAASCATGAFCTFSEMEELDSRSCDASPIAPSPQQDRTASAGVCCCRAGHMPASNGNGDRSPAVLSAGPLPYIASMVTLLWLCCQKAVPSICARTRTTAMRPAEHEGSLTTTPRG